jgi:ribose-phosphate pyrophosphokinase
MHAAQIQGFFDIPVDHLYAKPVLMRAVKSLDVENPVVVTPDVGGIKMARAWAKALHADLAFVDIRRISGSDIAVEHVIGDVKGSNVIVVDDMISTGGSICEAARILRREGAKKIVIAVSHAVLCGPAVERLDASPADKLLYTDTIPRHEKAPRQAEVVSVAALFGRAILNIHRAESVSSLFEELA